MLIKNDIVVILSYSPIPIITGKITRRHERTDKLIDEKEYQVERLSDFSFSLNESKLELERKLGDLQRPA